MANTARRYLVCDCEGTMHLDDAALAHGCASPKVAVHTRLCADERRVAEEALADPGPLVIACRQQEPLFRRLAEATGRTGPIGFADIRESAAWTAEAPGAGPKIAAILAAATAQPSSGDTISLTSQGRCLVYGCDDQAVAAASRLAARLQVSLLLDPAGADSVMLPHRFDTPIHRGRIVAMSGHLGAYRVTVEGHAEISPSSRGTVRYGSSVDRATTECDIVLDLNGGAPLLPGGKRRHGYLRPDARDPVAVERALYDAAELVGTFDKPRYVEFQPSLCAHSRNGRTGCTRCLDACPLSAIATSGDVVAIDSGICDGCGICHAVCPSGAVRYDGPDGRTLLDRLRTLLTTWRAAGGGEPVLLIHDERRGEEAIRLMAQFGRGLPAHVIPLDTAEPGRVGLDILLPALAYGAAEIVVLVDPAEGAPEGLSDNAALASTIVAGLGYGEGRVAVWDEIDPEVIESRLHESAVRPNPAAARFTGQLAAREAARLALEALHVAALAPVDCVALDQGAPFGAIAVDHETCTLCLACVPLCPAGALADNPDLPQLGFTESACIQCGLCRATCPERAIDLIPRVSFTDAARRRLVLNEEAPAACSRCGKPFGTRRSIERVIARLSGHAMFNDPKMLARMTMCGDCRVRDQFETGREPMRGRPPPRARTAEDDAAEGARPSRPNAGVRR